MSFSTQQPMHQFQQFLAELESKGQSALSRAKPPQQLYDFLIDHVVTLTAVHGGKPDRAMVLELLSRIVRKAKPCYSSVVLAMFYLDRVWAKMSQRQPGAKPSNFGTDGLPELITAFILADKYLYDIALANCEWVKVSGVFSLTDVNAFEREFLALLDYNIQFSELAFKEFVSFLEVRLLIRQHKMEAMADFPLTYADLVAHNNALALQHKQEQEQQHQHQHHQKVFAPQPQTLALLRLLMACCVACCAVALTFTTAVVVVERSAAVAAAAASTTASKDLPKEVVVVQQHQQQHQQQHHPQLPEGLFKAHPLTKSESWSSFSPSQAMVKAKARKFSDAMLGEQNQIFLTPVGKVRS